MLSSYVRFLVVILTIFFGLQSMAAKSLAVVTMLKGKAEVFINPSLQASGPKPRVKFESHYYTVRPAKIGFQLKFNQIVKTSPNGMAKVTFANGDSLMLGPGTALNMEVYSDKSDVKQKSNQMLNLIYGNARGVISKEGPRSGLKIKTKSAVAGVRGTDFNVRFLGAKNSTELSVIRGSVAVRQKDQPRSKFLVLKKGYIAEITNLPEISSALPEKGQGPMNSAIGAKSKLGGISSLSGFEKPVKIQVLSRQKLKQISKESILVSTQSELEKQPEGIQSLVTSLEKKSIQVILEDIKTEDPEHYQNIKSKSEAMSDSSQLNNQVITELTEKAPEVEEAEKISEEELMKGLDSGEDVYKKYFK